MGLIVFPSSGLQCPKREGCLGTGIEIGDMKTIMSGETKIQVQQAINMHPAAK